MKRSYKEVEIEERSPEELIFFEEKQIAPLEVKVYNPAFDFTPFELIEAVIMEEGVYRHSTQQVSGFRCWVSGLSNGLEA
jgi:methylthioribose-1-phosphate isomerase